MSSDIGLRKLYSRASKQQLQQAEVHSVNIIRVYFPLRNTWETDEARQGTINTVRLHCQRLRIIRERLGEL